MDATTKSTAQPVHLVPVDSIRVSGNWRTLAEESIDPLTQSIAEVGLLHPIIIAPDGTLVAGRHRLEAVKRLRRPSIPARVVDRGPLHRELITIDENIQRAPLTCYEHMTVLARRKELYEALNPEARHGGTRTPGAEREGAKSFVADTADKTGYHKDSISKLVRIRRKLIDLPATLNDHPIMNNMRELELLSRKDREEQEAIVHMLESGEAKTVKEAVAARNGHDTANPDGDGEGAPSVELPDSGDHPQVHHRTEPPCSGETADLGETAEGALPHGSSNGARPEPQHAPAPPCVNVGEGGQAAVGYRDQVVNGDSPAGQAGAAPACPTNNGAESDQKALLTPKRATLEQRIDRHTNGLYAVLRETGGDPDGIEDQELPNDLEAIQKRLHKFVAARRRVGPKEKELPQYRPVGDPHVCR